MSDINSFREKLSALVSKFEKDRTHYLSRGYPEALKSLSPKVSRFSSQRRGILPLIATAFSALGLCPDFLLRGEGFYRDGDDNVDDKNTCPDFLLRGEGFYDNLEYQLGSVLNVSRFSSQRRGILHGQPMKSALRS